MCVWMGVLGCEDASRKAIGMLKKTEGIWGGFYTGMVTLCNGEFRSDKIMGDTGKWDNCFTPFPGRIALVHSRTASGGGSVWGHPFIASEIASAAQGSSGIFKQENALFAEAGNRLLREGIEFSSADFSFPPGRYTTLVNGAQVHVSEIITQAVNREYQKCGDRFEAIRRGFGPLPVESVFVFIFRDDPEAFYLGNVNQRVIFGEDREGLYIGTTSIAFPTGIGRLTEVPGNTIAKIGRDEVVFRRFSAKYAEEPEIPEGAETAFTSWLAANPGALLGHIADNALRPLFPEGILAQCAVCAWRILEKLYASGRIRFESVPWEYEESGGRIFRLYLLE